MSKSIKNYVLIITGMISFLIFEMVLNNNVLFFSSSKIVILMPILFLIYMALKFKLSDEFYYINGILLACIYTYLFNTSTLLMIVLFYVLYIYVKSLVNTLSFMNFIYLCLIYLGYFILTFIMSMVYNQYNGFDFITFLNMIFSATINSIMLFIILKKIYK